MSNDEMREAFERLADLFSIGEKARDVQTVLYNVQNAKRRSDCLSEIEDRFTFDHIDEDGFSGQECLLNWGASPEQYGKDFDAALQSRVPVSAMGEEEISKVTFPYAHKGRVIGQLASAQYAARALIAAGFGRQDATPEGWSLVPNGITREMQLAYFNVIDRNLDRVESDAAFGRHESQKEAYRAMLAAAPKPAALNQQEQPTGATNRSNQQEQPTG